MTEADFRRLFDEHYAGMRSFCARMVADDAVAEDLVQDVFVRVWMRRHDLDATRLHRAYFLRSARNAALGWLRRASPARIDPAVPPPESLIDRTDPGLNLDADRLQSRVNAAIDRLPIRCREVFLLVRERGLSYRETAEVLDIRPKTVDAHMVRAMRELRHALSSDPTSDLDRRTESS